MQALAEERSKAEQLAAERDAAENRTRQAETKALSLSRELEELQIKLEESERSRRNVQGELNAVLESKDDAGKSVCTMHMYMYSAHLKSFFTTCYTSVST